MDALPKEFGAFWAAVGGAAVMILGTFGPWVHALEIVSRAGIEGDGLYVAGAGVTALALLWNYAQTRSHISLAVAMGCAVIGAAVSGYDYTQITGTRTDFFGQDLQVGRAGWGLYGCLLGCGILFFACLTEWITPQLRDTEPAT